MKKYTLGDWLITGEIVIIGLAEVSHLAALFLKLPFTRCALLFGGLAGGVLLVGAVYGGLRMKGRFERGETPWAQRSWDTPERLLYAAFAAMALSQLCFIGMGNIGYRQGDMTVETVESFLACDGLYQVNPMTGMPYREGIPLRLKILCLPTLYGSICRLTGLRPVTFVQVIVPMAVLLSSYVAFGAVGRALFPGDGRKRACFLLIVSLLLWTGAYRYGMDGFNVLCCGWRGVSVRSGVLLPWTVSLCLRGRWRSAVLCVLAECCLVWTLYGFGACAAVAAGMAMAQWCSHRFARLAAGRGQEDVK